MNKIRKEKGREDGFRRKGFPPVGEACLTMDSPPVSSALHQGDFFPLSWMSEALLRLLSFLLWVILWKTKGFVLYEDEQKEQMRRKIAGWTIALLCIGIVILASAASAQYLPSILRFALCGVGGVLLLCSLIVLACIDQDDARHNFGHSGGFACPLVPFLPVSCILINTYLLADLGTATWIRVSIWLLVGALVYVFYGRTHSALLDAIYVPSAHADEIYRCSSAHQA